MEKKQELVLGLKLKRGILVSKRGGSCGTPSPKWKHGFDHQPPAADGSFPENLNFPTSQTLSARKLGANLWEILPHLKDDAKMRRRRPKRHTQKEKGLEVLRQGPESPDTPPQQEQPATPSSLRRHVSSSLAQRHQSVGRNGYVVQPPSPASCSSSKEVAPYNRVVAPTSSSDFEGRVGESTFNFKTSKDLLKVLNRIWSLEEQHASNISMVKVLKVELDRSRAQIKELLHEKTQVNHREMEELMKRKEHERIKASVKSVKNELDDERKLRKHSESLHRKLARELSAALKELESEKKARVLMEDLCDEFAKGVRDYEQEVRFLKNKHEKDHRIHRENHDQLVLHLSEAWLDERLQMKQAPDNKSIIADNLSSEIETVLQSKRRHSLESFHLNEAVSAPRNGDDEGESAGSDLNCVEMNGKSISLEEKLKSKSQRQFDERVAEVISSNRNRMKILDRQVGNHEPDSSHVLDSLIRTRLSSMEPESDRVQDPEYSRRWPRGSKESTLKAKLLEARLDSRHARSKTSRASKG